MFSLLWRFWAWGRLLLLTRVFILLAPLFPSWLSCLVTLLNQQDLWGLRFRKPNELWYRKFPILFCWDKRWKNIATFKHWEFYRAVISRAGKSVMYSANAALCLIFFFPLYKSNPWLGGIYLLICAIFFTIVVFVLCSTF